MYITVNCLVAEMSYTNKPDLLISFKAYLSDFNDSVIVQLVS